MKFYSSALPELITKIQQGEIKSLLIYGVNNGLASTITKQIIKKTNALASELSIKETNSGSLNLIANRTNFFQQKEFIQITGIKNTISSDLQKFISSGEYENFICLISNESLPPSGVRKLYENGKNIASIACYYENENVISKVILQYAKKNKKIIENDALFYLKTHLKGDNQIIKSELEKIFNFTHDQEKISKHDVENVLSSDLAASGDEMCIYFAKKEASRFLQEINKLKLQNINEVLMLRALGRYFMNIYIVTKKIESGCNIDLAIKSLYPPVFFKYITDFKQIIRNYSPCKALAHLKYIQQAEINFKTDAKSFDPFLLYQKCTHL